MLTVIEVFSLKSTIIYCVQTIMSNFMNFDYPNGFKRYVITVFRLFDTDLIQCIQVVYMIVDSEIQK